MILTQTIAAGNCALGDLSLTTTLAGPSALTLATEAILPASCVVVLGSR